MKELVEIYVQSFLDTYYGDADYSVPDEEIERILDKSVNDIMNDDYIWQMFDELILKNLK